MLRRVGGQTPCVVLGLLHPEAARATVGMGNAFSSHGPVKCARQHQVRMTALFAHDSASGQLPMLCTLTQQLSIHPQVDQQVGSSA